MLAQAARLRTADEFRTTLRRGVRCARPTLVLHMMRTDNPPSRAGFVVSKAVGGAVVRNRVKRRLRALMAARLTTLPRGCDVVLRANPGSAHATYAELSADLERQLAAVLRS